MFSYDFFFFFYNSIICHFLSRLIHMGLRACLFAHVHAYLMLGEDWWVVVFILHCHNHSTGTVQTCQGHITSSQLLLVSQGQSITQRNKLHEAANVSCCIFHTLNSWVIAAASSVTPEAGLHTMSTVGGSMVGNMANGYNGNSSTSLCLLIIVVVYLMINLWLKTVNNE